MSWINILNLAGGLALFLYGMTFWAMAWRIFRAGAWKEPWKKDQQRNQKRVAGCFGYSGNSVVFGNHRYCGGPGKRRHFKA